MCFYHQTAEEQLTLYLLHYIITSRRGIEFQCYVLRYGSGIDPVCPITHVADNMDNELTRRDVPLVIFLYS